MDRFISPSKGIQDSLGFWILSREFRIPGILGRSGRFFVSWKLDSRFQSLVGFQIPRSVFRIPKPKIADFTSKKFPNSGIRIPLHGAIVSMHVLFFKFRPRDVTPEN